MPSQGSARVVFELDGIAYCRACFEEAGPTFGRVAVAGRQLLERQCACCGAAGGLVVRLRPAQGGAK